MRFGVVTVKYGRAVAGLLGILVIFGGVGWSQSEPTRSDVRIVSSFVAAGAPVPQECREEAVVFARMLVRYPRPDAWHWVLVCDEAGWRRFLRLSGLGERETILASTDLSERTTYFDGSKLLFGEPLGTSPEAVLGHEMAHIQLNSRDEEKVESLARSWLGLER